MVETSVVAPQDPSLHDSRPVEEEGTQNYTIQCTIPTIMILNLCTDIGGLIEDVNAETLRSIDSYLARVSVVQPSTGLELAEVIRAASLLQGSSTEASSSMMANRPDALEAVQLEFRAIDLEEESKIDHFYSTTCGCLKACIKQFTREHVRLTRANVAQLSRSDLDMVLLGQVMASTHCSQLPQNATDDPDQQVKRKRNSVIFYHQGKKFVGTLFCFSILLGSFALRLSKPIIFLKSLFPAHMVIAVVFPQMLWY